MMMNAVKVTDTATKDALCLRNVQGKIVIVTKHPDYVQMVGLLESAKHYQICQAVYLLLWFNISDSVLLIIYLASVCSVFLF